MKKAKIAALLSAIILCAGSLPVFAQEIEIPQYSPSIAQLNDITADIGTVESGDMIDFVSGNLLDAGDVEDSDVAITVEILDEFDLPGYSENEANIDTADILSAAEDEVVENEPSTRAALPDLAVVNLNYSNFEEPFPLSVQIPFQFQVGNMGSAPAPSSQLEIFFNNGSKGKTTLPIIPAGKGLNLEVGAACKDAGKWEIKLTVNAAKAFSESNYANNTLAKSFLWKGEAIPDTGLQLMSFYPADSKTTLLEGKRTRFLFDVANTSTKNVARPQIKIELRTLGGTPVTSSTQDLGAIPAQQAMMNAYFDLEIERRGGYVLKATILSPAEFTDPDMADNRREVSLIVTYNDEGKNFCTHFRNGKFPDGSELSIFMESSVDVVTSNQIATAASYWNGITDRISYKNLSTTSPKEITIRQIIDKIPGYEKAIAVTESSPDTEASIYNGAVVKLSGYWFNRFTDKHGWSAFERKTACIAHELGHVVGVLHSNVIKSDGKDGVGCPYPSIMCSSIEDANYSAVMEDHDLFNLYRRYK